MSKVTLKLSGKAVVKLSGGEAIVGTWNCDWKEGQSVFQGRTNDGKTSDWMKKRELREWFAQEGQK